MNLLAETKGSYIKSIIDSDTEIDVGEEVNTSEFLSAFLAIKNEVIK